MTYETILRTVQVGLKPNGDFDIGLDTYDVAAHAETIVTQLNAHLPQPDGQAIVDTYRKYQVAPSPGNSPFDVVSVGPTIFLYIVDTSTMDGWRFDGSRGFMERKPDAPQTPEVFERNFPLSFQVMADSKGVTMFATCDTCVDHNEGSSRDPNCVFAFDIFMTVIQANGNVTKVTIDPDTDNDNGGNRITGP